MAKQPRPNQNKKKKNNLGRKVQKLVAKHLKTFTTDPIDGVSVSLINDSIAEWEVEIVAPKETPYSGGTFIFNIKFNKWYPIQPPRAKVITPIYHVNITRRGMICLDILIDEWNDKLTVRDVINEILESLQEPALHNPINELLAVLFVYDFEK